MYSKIVVGFICLCLVIGCFGIGKTQTEAKINTTFDANACTCREGKYGILFSTTPDKQETRIGICKKMIVKVMENDTLLIIEMNSDFTRLLNQ
jgi:hypothetical protein